jgi:hypothetical protein
MEEYQVMQSRHKTLRELETYLKPHKIEIVGDEMMKRHRKVWLTDGRSIKFITMSISPSDHRTYLNLSKDARKMFREAP